MVVMPKSRNVETHKGLEKVTKTEDSVTEEESDEFDQILENCKVRFQEAVKRYEVLSLEDYTERERKKTWYDSEDKEKMQEKHNKMVRRYEKGKKCKQGMTYRGLECWTKEGSVQLDSVIASVVDAVMDEQDDQWASGKDDWKKIAEASRVISKQSRRLARAVAKEDEQEAIEAQKTQEEENVSDTDSKGSIHTVRSLKFGRRKRSERMRKQSEKSKRSGDTARKTRLRSRKPSDKEASVSQILD